MIRATVIVLLLVAGFVVWNAPAGILRNAFNEAEGVDLVGTSGTLWQGNGTLVVDGAALGHLEWRIKASRLFALALAYDVQLASEDIDLTGDLQGATGGFAAALNGRVTNAAINRALSTYQITMEGDVAVEGLDLAARYDRRIERLEGTLRWQGGEVLYPEASGQQRASLPPLLAVLGSDAGHATASVFPEGGSTPVLMLRTLDDGYYRLSVTKLLTKLVGRPWRGSDPDHAVVVELEEQFL